MTRYSLDLRRRVVHAYKQHGATMRSVAQDFQVNVNTVLAWVKKERESGSLEPKPYGGGRTSLVLGRETQLAEMVQQYPDATLAEYCEVWRESTEQDVHPSTMGRWLRKENYTLKKN